MKRDVLLSMGVLVILIVLVLPRTGVAQEWQQADCTDLKIQFDPHGVLSAYGTKCWQLETAKGRLEALNARAVNSMSVTILHHVESFDGGIARSEIADFVDATGSFTRASDWSQATSIDGYQVWKFMGELSVDPFWKTSCVALSRYDGGSNGKFKHQISGFSCVDPESWAGGMTDAETADLISRIQASF